MNVNIDAIEKRLEELTETRRKNVQTTREQLEKTQQKVKDLEAKLVSIQDLDEYVQTKNELNEQRDNLSFLQSKAKKNPDKLLEEAEYQSIRKEITEEIDLLQDKYAPEIQKKVLEVIDLMDEYDSKIKPLEALVSRAHHFYLPTFSVGKLHFAADIGKRANDECGWWSKFVYMYYQHADTAKSIKNGTQNKRGWFS